MEYEVKVKIVADDEFDAEMQRQGLQNLVEQLGADNDILVSIADKAKAQKYGSKIRDVLNNSFVRRMLGV